MSIKSYKDKNGITKYYCSFYYDYNGTRRRKKLEGFTRRKDAKQAETDFLEKIKTGSDITFLALCNNYLKDCETRFKPTTMQSKRYIVKKRFIPFFGKSSMNGITAAMVRNWQNQMLSHTPPFKPTYLKLCNSQLTAIFNYAKKFYGLGINPVNIAGTIGKLSANRMDFYTIEEYKRFSEILKDSKALHTAFELLYFCGLRCGELLALTASDFCAADDTISISKTYTRIKKQDIVTTPKTEKSKRVIQLPHTAAVHLNDYINTMYEPKPQERIFATLNRYILKKALTNAANKAGLKVIRLHDFRHSHASLLIEMGFSPLAISERLGHEDVQTTLSIYSHLYPHKQNEIASKLNDFLK